jgi:hypothetical protein
VREIRTPRSMRGVWKRSYGQAIKAPPDERDGNGFARPNAAAPHPYSIHASCSSRLGPMALVEPLQSFIGDPANGRSRPDQAIGWPVRRSRNRTFSMAGCRPLCAHSGRSRPPRRQSNAAVRSAFSNFLDWRELPTGGCRRWQAPIQSLPFSYDLLGHQLQSCPIGGSQESSCLGIARSAAPLTRYNIRLCPSAY